MNSPTPISRTAAALFCGIILTTESSAAEPVEADHFDVSKWALPDYPEVFFQGRTACGEDALTFWMQGATYRGNAGKLPQKRTQIERLWSGDATEVARVNQELLADCRRALADTDAFRKKSARTVHLWIVLALRARDQLTPETRAAIEEAVRAMDLTQPDSGYMNWIEIPGSNGANVHGHLTPLALGPELIRDDAARWAAYWGFRRELDHMNTTGDVNEFNLLESHWTGTGEWELMKHYLTDPSMRRMARLISERLWINRFLTWSSAVERNTGPGSRMAPNEWLGCDNERFLFATGVEKPIWLNFFFPWDGWNSRAPLGTWPLTQSEAMVPDLPSYLQDLAWRKSFPNELQCALNWQAPKNYPRLSGVADGDPGRPMKYVNYQAANYTLGSSTASWVVNTCYVGMSAFWNNSRNPAAPLGSPERFCALYPHYVVNGMSVLDQGDIYFDNAPTTPLADAKGGPRGPWMREFIEFGRLGAVQDRNTLIASYTTKPGTHYAGLVKDKVQRASAAMFLLRWTDGTDGLFVNREPVRSLPVELKPGDWWFIEDGDVYAAVRPLETTRLRGGRTILEKRTRHVVLYEDNVAAENIQGIADEDWVKARSGFVVEMGDRAEYGSFAQFQNQILAGKVTADEVDGFNRHIAYERGDRRLEMRWHAYTEEYATRQINGRDDPWERHLQSPEFAVNETGRLAVKDATLQTTAGKAAWLLSCATAQTWVAYQPNAEQDLPFDLTCPIGRVSAARFPFGKLALKQNRDRSLLLDIDASYRPFFASGKKYEPAQRDGTLPSELVLEAAAPKVEAQINGMKCQPHREARAGREVWVINPYDNARALLETARPAAR
jgi:hypothetical protein